MELNRQQIEVIAEIIVQKIGERDRAFRMEPELHYLDHQYVQQIRENETVWQEVVDYVRQEKQLRERRMGDARKLRNQILGVVISAGMLGFFGLLGAWAIGAVRDFIRAAAG